MTSLPPTLRTPPDSRGSDCRRTLRACGRLAAAGGLVAWAALRRTPQDRLDEVAAELRARGEPTSLREIEQPLPPEGHHGAPLLEAALAWRDARLIDDYGWADRIVGPWNTTIETPLPECTPEQIAELREFLEPLAPFFEQIERAVACDEIAWPLGPLDHSGYELRSSGVVSPVHRFLLARAFAGESAEIRLSAIQTELALARRLRVLREIDHLIATTIFGSACRALTRALASDSIDPRMARARLEPLLLRSFRSDLPSVLRGSRAEWSEMLPFWFDGSAQAALGADFDELSFWEGAREFAEDAWSGKLWRADPFSKQELPEQLLAMDTIIALDPFSGRAYVDALDDFSGGRLVFVLFPRVVTKSYLTDCHMALARVALASCVYREDHGEWPREMSALAPLFPEGVPLDPYTDAPFVMELAGDELVISAEPWEDVVDAEATLDEYGLRVRLQSR